jgi:hypothetical protein
MAIGLRSTAAPGYLGALLATAMAAGCGGKSFPSTRIVIAHQAASSRCVPTSGMPADDAPITTSAEPISSLRLSVRTHATVGDKGAFACDLVVAVPSQLPTLKLPLMNAAAVDIYAEGFAAPRSGMPPDRVAVAALLDVPAASASIKNIRLVPADSFRCVPYGMVRPRAFHTATKLPNNQVLILGGLVASTTVPSSETIGLAPLFVTGDAEIYDPATQTFTKVAEKSGTAIARAFHQATLIDSSGGKFTLLVVGGATVSDATMPAMGLNTGAAKGPRLVPFDTSDALFLMPLSTRAATTAELVVYDPATTSVTRTRLDGFMLGAFAAAAPFTDGIAVAGGTDWGDPLNTEVPVQAVSARRGMETPRMGPLSDARIGATLTPLSDDTALVWGGQITTTDPQAELVSGLSVGGIIGSTPAMTTGDLPTQFHTATPVNTDATSATQDILVTGGFIETTQGTALLPPQSTMGPAARIVTVAKATGAATVAPATLGGGYAEDPTCMATKRYRPAGWEAAVALPDGRVLVAGGAPTYQNADASTTPPTPACNDCDGGSGLFCATRQASIFTPPATLSPVTEPLQVARFGHAVTLLGDGSVLVSGGIGAGAGTPRLIGDGELYNPRPLATAATGDANDPLAADLKQLGLTRAPGQAATAVNGKTPAHPCGEL